MATKKAAGGLPSSGAGSPPENRARQRPRAASGGLQPKVMGTALSLHGVVIIAALAIGAHEGGVAGALLAVPLTAVLWASFKTFRDMRDGVPGKLPAEDDEAAPAVQA
ncbi:AI-2E family transporter [Kocuria rhizophila]|nr:AI-2E family transporter [Kocuria rhizophila]